jgi:hypothetical protein
MKLFSRSPSKRRVIIRSGLAGLLLGGALALAAWGLHEEAAPNYYGEYKESVKAAAATLDVRDNCKIGKFGVAPWRKQAEPKDAAWEAHTRLALSAMALTPAAVDKAVVALRRAPDTAAVLGNRYGMPINSGSYYLPVFETTFRRSDGVYTICHASTTDFADDQQMEGATVHVIQDGAMTYHIGEFLACGNISRFLPAPPGWLPYGMQRPKAAVPAPGASGAAGAGNQIPEPSSLALGWLALALAFFFGAS